MAASFHFQLEGIEPSHWFACLRELWVAPRLGLRGVNE
jgi:hypothetical protein